MIRTGLRRGLARFAAREEGTATVEFVIYFPIIMFLVMTAFEVGQVNIRRAILERGTDLMVREVRLNPGQNFEHQALKELFCREAGSVFPRCTDTITIQIWPIERSGGAWNFMEADLTCATDLGDDIEVPEITAGGGNELIQIRTCAEFPPIFPTLWIGRYLLPRNGADYRLISMSAFINEPS